ncbi:hypothetical protein LFYK43_16380 [Ligilactobacillus salitolerans]|uniref:Phage protein n=1 Tax=Ligilactobacillus salitolerans TaxID=1808352 RepID=A0A401IUH7_9LACO|nr:hypothetical protein [Ligilactobacillus salitolerans]GBG95179.1 hypothetical protein LFYK43_16380 [Ligilactobacillus salitolerans]
MVKYKVFSLAEILDLFKEQEEKLNDYFKEFSCPKEKELEDFLVNSAIHYEKIEYGKTFLILNAQKIQNGVIDIIAFFTIGQKSIDISKMSQKKKRKVIGSSIPGRDRLKSISGFLIGELGRNSNYTHDDLPGSIILQECYKQIEKARMIIGGNLIVLECRRKMFKKFYEEQSFHRISEDASDDGLIMLYRKVS